MLLSLSISNPFPDRLLSLLPQSGYLQHNGILPAVVFTSLIYYKKALSKPILLTKGQEGEISGIGADIEESAAAD